MANGSAGAEYFGYDYVLLDLCGEHLTEEHFKGLCWVRRHSPPGARLEQPVALTPASAGKS